MARLSENWLDDPVVVGVEERSSAPGQLVHRFLYVHGADKDRVAARLIRVLRALRGLLRHQA